MSNRDRSKKSTSARPRRRASKPGRTGQPVTTIHTASEATAATPFEQQRSATVEPPRIVGIIPPIVTFVHFQNETRIYVDGVLRRTVDRHVGHNIQRVVESIEATGAVKIAEQRLDNLVNADDIFGSARQ